jgi:hypothetical protein
MRSQSVEESRPTNPWVHLAIGVFLVGFAYYMYGDLTAFEDEGGERKMHAVFAALYNIFGKWGVVAPLGLAGLGFAASFIRKLGKPRQE